MKNVWDLATPSSLQSTPSVLADKPYHVVLLSRIPDHDMVAPERDDDNYCDNYCNKIVAFNELQAASYQLCTFDEQRRFHAHFADPQAAPFMYAAHPQELWGNLKEIVSVVPADQDVLMIKGPYFKQLVFVVGNDCEAYKYKAALNARDPFIREAKIGCFKHEINACCVIAFTGEAFGEPQRKLTCTKSDHTIIHRDGTPVFFREIMAKLPQRRIVDKIGDFLRAKCAKTALTP
ncbi:MAG TPA: hypothetical protein DCY07_05525 [Rhodospirillaceae bacterium]|nr:hypothetical protein [Rhodospirillaceae bacterium]